MIEHFGGDLPSTVVLLLMMLNFDPRMLHQLLKMRPTIPKFLQRDVRMPSPCLHGKSTVVSSGSKDSCYHELCSILCSTPQFTGTCINFLDFLIIMLFPSGCMVVKSGVCGPWITAPDIRTIMFLRIQ